MTRLEAAGILGMGLSRLEDDAVHGFIGIGLGVPQRLIRAFALIGGKEMREGRGDLRPFSVFFVEAVLVSIERRDFCVRGCVELKPAMASTDS